MLAALPSNPRIRSSRVDHKIIHMRTSTSMAVSSVNSYWFIFHFQSVLLQLFLAFSSAAPLPQILNNSAHITYYIASRNYLKKTSYTKITFHTRNRACRSRTSSDLIALCPRTLFLDLTYTFRTSKCLKFD